MQEQFKTLIKMNVGQGLIQLVYQFVLFQGWRSVCSHASMVMDVFMHVLATFIVNTISENEYC